MALHQYKTVILIITAVVALMLASPAVEQFAVLPQITPFTEFAMFGPYNNATYPSNATTNQDCRFYLEVANHLGSTAYYVIEVKFRNATQSAPDSFNKTSSTLPALSELTAVVADNGSVRFPLDISLQYELDEKNSSLLHMQSVTVNGAALGTDTTIAWNIQENGFYGNLFFELYVYNDTTGVFQYHERYVSLWLNLETARSK